MIKWKLWKVTFIVLRTNQFTITTQETTTFKTFEFNILTSYESSGNDYFVLNSDSITIKAEYIIFIMKMSLDQLWEGITQGVTCLHKINIQILFN